MITTENENIRLVRMYMKALESGDVGDSLRKFFTDDVRQIELPNQLNKNGQESDLEHILERSRQGLKTRFQKWSRSPSPPPGTIY